MARNKAALKSRIKSVTSTKKITGAMELIANSKLLKDRNMMTKNKEYSEALQGMISEIITAHETIKNTYLEEKTSPSKLYFVFCSDLGLCGAYNANIIKLVQNTVKEDDYLMVVGKSEYSWLKNHGYHILNDMIGTDEIGYMELKHLIEESMHMFCNNQVSSVGVIYTKFINNISFEPAVDTILPINREDNKVASTREIIFDPKPGLILDSIIPMMVVNSIYFRWLMSITSEQGSRRFAMENATDNANELVDKLVLQYNQARQAAITQEITEIIGGADAL